MIRRTFCAAAAAAAVLATSSAAFAEEPLKIGVEGAYPPFSYTEADGTLAGFDIDIAKALCAEVKRECELVQQEWDGMIPALKAHKFDAIVASMSITEERQRQVDFTDKYYQTPARVVASKETDLTDTDEGLAGKRLGVQRGTTHQCYAEKAFPDADLVLYGTQEEVFRDLAIGRLDAQLSDSLIAQKGFLDKSDGKDFAFVGGDHLDLECYGEGVGIAVRKGDDEMREALNGAISAIRDDGTYKKINDKYFSFDVYGGRPESADASN